LLTLLLTLKPSQIWLTKKPCFDKTNTWIVHGNN
jgi:hypothetical protein